MKIDVYLVVTAKGAVRLTKRLPGLYREEIAVKVRLNIPDSAFRSPVLTAELNVADELVIQPQAEIEALAESPDQ